MVHATIWGFIWEKSGDKLFIGNVERRGFFVLVISVLAVTSYIGFIDSLKKNYAHQLKLEKRDTENIQNK